VGQTASKWDAVKLRTPMFRGIRHRPTGKVEQLRRLLEARGLAGLLAVSCNSDMGRFCSMLQNRMPGVELRSSFQEANRDLVGT
jgi:hypothetical protein